ncbi:anti-sigma B factor antagonist/stage II sporulation protein AA (anti-sigma F factor antagonist) [Anoxybacillus calidus]|jgi:anti-anti-sigma factor|uniref:Anti-sigma B factor antagonist/stage II sporulation protein AA (Anti-sigma F factor antagonist) n=1 Tax=[Anoxybacillus] calidus TaxID=575178 RepID=A0A7W0BVN5_9BACL|nr:STAS domain-containing protein [Anoxybacillus calidus]MBA2870386.1 anti-sigma B factor antagonist/stage II sporulation protein AA (anti-sigma F factor antagonist) [Anoxybacillus calidus]
MFSYELIEDNEKAVIYFKGDLDIEVTEIIEEQVIPLLKFYKNVDIDMSEVLFVDSTGIGLLINLVDTLRNTENDIKVTISNIHPQVQEVFEIIQLKEILGEEVLR